MKIPARGLASKGNCASPEGENLRVDESTSPALSRLFLPKGIVFGMKLTMSPCGLLHASYTTSPGSLDTGFEPPRKQAGKRPTAQCHFRLECVIEGYMDFLFDTSDTSMDLCQLIEGQGIRDASLV